MQIHAHCVIGFEMLLACRTVCHITVADFLTLPHGRSLLKTISTRQKKQFIMTHQYTVRLTSATSSNSGSHLKSRPPQTKPSGISFLWDTSWELQRQEILKKMKIFRTKMPKEVISIDFYWANKKELDSN